MRTNARLSHEQHRQIEELREATGASASDVIRTAIEHYHQEIFGRGKAALVRLIGIAEGPEDLSERHEEYLSTGLDTKHGPG